MSGNLVTSKSTGQIILGFRVPRSFVAILNNQLSNFVSTHCEDGVYRIEIISVPIEVKNGKVKYPILALKADIKQLER